MQNFDKDFLNKVHALAKNTADCLSYYSDYVKSYFKPDKSFKGISYLIFDKENKPYLAVPDMDYFCKENRAEKTVDFKILALEKKDKGLCFVHIGDIFVLRDGKLFETDFIDDVKKAYKTELIKHLFKFKINKKQILQKVRKKEALKRQNVRKDRVDELALLEILKKRYIFKGLGKEMYKLFEYNSFIMGATKMTGTVSAINVRFIKKNDLNRFYKDRKVELNNNKMQKQYDLQEQKTYAKRIATFSKNGVIIKVVFPENTKKYVMELLHNNFEKRTSSVISNIKEI